MLNVNDELMMMMSMIIISVIVQEFNIITTNEKQVEYTKVLLYN